MIIKNDICGSWAGRGTLDCWPTCRRPTPRIRWPPPYLPSFLSLYLPAWIPACLPTQPPTGHRYLLLLLLLLRGRPPGSPESGAGKVAFWPRWLQGYFLTYIHSRRRAEVCTRPLAHPPFLQPWPPPLRLLPILPSNLTFLLSLRPPPSLQLLLSTCLQPHPIA